MQFFDSQLWMHKYSAYLNFVIFEYFVTFVDIFFLFYVINLGVMNLFVDSSFSILTILNYNVFD